MCSIVRSSPALDGKITEFARARSIPRSPPDLRAPTIPHRAPRIAPRQRSPAPQRAHHRPARYPSTPQTTSAPGRGRARARAGRRTFPRSPLPRARLVRLVLARPSCSPLAPSSPARWRSVFTRTRRRATAHARTRPRAQARTRTRTRTRTPPGVRTHPRAWGVTIERPSHKFCPPPVGYRARFSSLSPARCRACDRALVCVVLDRALVGRSCVRALRFGEARGPVGASEPWRVRGREA